MKSKKNHVRQAIFLLGLIAVFFQTEAFAKTYVGGGLFQKSQNRESTRWTLADWMTQKKSMRAMDQWLAFHRSKDLFEFNIEGGQQTYDVTVGASVEEKRIDRYGASFYWSIFGLEYEREESTEDFIRESGQFNLRLFGVNSQTTNLVVYYGVRRWEFESPSNEVKNQYAGTKLNLYVVSFFGLEGQYRHFFRANDSSNVKYEGSRAEYGAFIDVYFVRLYGRGFKEIAETTPSGGVTTEHEREGVEAGIKLYF